MRDWLRALCAGRPWWMNALMFFCGYMAFVYLPWDFLVKPAGVDEEVWFGIRFHGLAAKLLEIPHWAIYALGAYGFRHMRPWMWPWAAVYAGQVALGMLVWNALYVGGFVGLLLGVVSFLPFLGLAWVDESVGEGPNFAARVPDVWSAPNHNHLRITRILRSLMLLGKEAEAEALYARLAEMSTRRKYPIPADTVHYWTSAIERSPEGPS